MARKQLGASPSNSVDATSKTYVDTAGALKSFAMTTTGVKTGAYTSAANEFIPADATSAGFTVTLPTSPVDKTRVAIKKMDATTNLVTIAVGGLDHINSTSGATSMTLVLQHQAVTFQYMFSSSVWYIVSSDAPLTALDARYVTPAGTQTLTSKTLTDPKIANDIYDLSGNRVFGLVSAGASASNYIYVRNAPSGAGPYFNAASQVDTDVNIGFAPQGAGYFYYYQPTGAVAKFQIDGVATNIDLNFVTKGTGKVQVNGNPAISSVTAIPAVTGTPSSSNYLRGDGTWASASAALRTTSTNAPGATPTWNTNSYDLWQFTGINTAITSMSTNFTSTSPTVGQRMMVSFKDNGTAQTITWGASFQSSGTAALLSTTVANKTHWVALMYDGTKWTCMASDSNGY